MYFRLGGGSIKGISKPGEIVWSRIFVDDGRLKMDLGRAGVVELPREETERRWQLTTPQWPIMHAVTYGVSRDQFMARHKANHIQVVYANSPKEADAAPVGQGRDGRRHGHRRVPLRHAEERQEVVDWRYCKLFHKGEGKLFGEFLSHRARRSSAAAMQTPAGQFRP